jgi:hypothetical protein
VSDGSDSSAIQMCKTCGHSCASHYYTHSQYPSISLESSCQEERCECDGYIQYDTVSDHICSCDGTLNGEQAVCCTGHVRGCLCDVDWDGV